MTCKRFRNMKTTKRIRVPFIEGLESMNMSQLDLAM